MGARAKRRAKSQTTSMPGALSHHVVSADRVLDRRRPTCVHFLDKTCKHFLSQFLDKTYLNSTANRKAQTNRNVNQSVIQKRHVSFSLISVFRPKIAVFSGLFP